MSTSCLLDCILPVFLQRDRITSFRKQGTKKEKPLIQHPTDPISTQTELPVPQPLFDERSMNLSEKEIVDLFEKMMVSFFVYLLWRVKIQTAQSPRHCVTPTPFLTDSYYQRLHLMLWVSARPLSNGAWRSEKWTKQCGIKYQTASVDQRERQRECRNWS